MSGDAGPVTLQVLPPPDRAAHHRPHADGVRPGRVPVASPEHEVSRAAAVPALTPTARALIRRLRAARTALDVEFRRGDRLAAANRDPDAAAFDRAQRRLWDYQDELAALGFTPHHVNHYLRKGL